MSIRRSAWGARLAAHPDNRTIFDELAAQHADIMVTDGVEVDLQARRHLGVLCPADVLHPFDSFEKAYWMTRDPALKGVVDALMQKSVQDSSYQRALTPMT